jgi:DNA-binding GntR family transcriptional regulator
MTVRRATYVQDAYAAIRGAIIDGTLAPGRKVVVRPLAQELGLSPAKSLRTCQPAQGTAR